MQELQKILVVEDDLIIQMFICAALRKVGFEIVAEARTSDEALILAETAKPDLILMDIGIAGKVDGIETAKLIREKTGVAIVFITGNSDQATLERAKATKPVAIVFKPIDEINLQRKILEACGH